MGMYDSIHVDCPHCGEKQEIQSKAGECIRATYPIGEVPVSISIDSKDIQNTCENCHLLFSLDSERTPSFVKMWAVKLSGEDQKPSDDTRSSFDF